MRSSSSRPVAALAVFCCVLTACGSGTGTSASTPSVVTSTVAAPNPATSGTPTASSSGSYDPALVAEAEKVFREYQATFIKWQQSGGSAQLPAEFLDLTSAPLQTEVAELLRTQKSAGWHLDTTPQPVIVVRGPIDSVRRPGQVIALDACVSYREVKVVSRDGTKKAGVAYEYHSFFKDSPKGLRYFDVERAEVSKC